MKSKVIARGVVTTILKVANINDSSFFYKFDAFPMQLILFVELSDTILPKSVYSVANIHIGGIPKPQIISY